MLTFFTRQDIQEILGHAFPKEGCRFQSLEKGLLNQNLRVQNQSGTFLLKIYRPEVTRDEADEMHRVMQFVQTQGIPVPELTYSSERNGQQVGVYTFLPGVNPNLYSGSQTRIATMGAMLGRMHVALEAYRKKYHLMPLKVDPPMPTADEKLKKIEGLCVQIREKKPPHAKELLKILDVYTERIASRPWDAKPFDCLPRHLCHGDFHTKNILFSGNTLTGVLDWEKFGWGGHAHEIMRSIIFNCRRTSASLNWQQVKTYILAYRKHQVLTPLECELAFPFVFHKMMFGTWAEEQYVKGQRELWDNVQRRQAINAYLFKYEARFTERISRLLSR